MRRRGTRTTAALACWLLAGAVLAGCGGEDADDTSGVPLDVALDGFHPADARPTPTALCDADPADPSRTSPALPGGLGSLEGAAQLVSAPTTIEAFAWTADDAGRAEDLLAEATAAAGPCTWTTSADLDGDGVAESPGGEAQQVGEWSAGDWAGLRITRTVPGQEQVDRRLVARGTVVLLIVTRADGDDPALLDVADDYLAGVAEQLG